MEYKIWDKKESINGVPANKILESNPNWVEADLILIIENGRITRIEDIQIIHANAGGNLFNENDSLEVKAQKMFQHIVNEREEQERIQKEQMPLNERVELLESALMEMAALSAEQEKRNKESEETILKLTQIAGGTK